MEKPYLFKGLSDGKNLVQFYENGNIKINQVLNENGRIESKNYDYFGNLKSISTYENKKLVNIRYIEEWILFSKRAWEKKSVNKKSFLW